VLLVVLLDNGPPPTGARQRRLEGRHGLVVVLPHVPTWAGVPGLPDEAATLFARPPRQLSPALRAYTQGLRLAVAALLRPAPPASARGAARATACASAAGRTDWCPPDAHPATATPPTPLDDDALEAEVLAAVARHRARLPGACTGQSPAGARTAEPTIPTHTPQPTTVPPVAARTARATAAEAPTSTHPAQPAAAPPVAARAARATAAFQPSTGRPVPGAPVVPPRIRARHRPVVGSVRVPAGKAGCG
jgi:hypothetical protein